jgi:hypothetical protein
MDSRGADGPVHGEDGTINVIIWADSSSKRRVTSGQRLEFGCGVRKFNCVVRGCKKTDAPKDAEWTFEVW